MRYDVKIKRYEVPDTHEKKCIIFLILNLSGPDTGYGSLTPCGSPQRRGQAEGAAPGASSGVCFIDMLLKNEWLK